MAVNVRKPQRTSGALRTVQDRPIPIESHGTSDQQISGLISAANQAIGNIKSPEIRVALESVIESVLIVRENKTQFDAIRRNIEILWNRGSEIAALQAISGSDIRKAEAKEIVPPVTPHVKDNMFYAYDLAGEIALGLIEVILTLDTEIIDDGAYDHTALSGIVCLVLSGDYFIDLDASFDMNEGDSVEMRLQRDTGSGYVDVPGAVGYCGA